MTYGLTINDNPPIWIEEASFVVISLVAGREQSVASLSIGGRHLSGTSKTWANANFGIGDHLAIFCKADNPSPKGGCSGNHGVISKFGNGNISGFALNVDGEDATLIEISAHDIVQVVGTWNGLRRYCARRNNRLPVRHRPSLPLNPIGHSAARITTNAGPSEPKRLSLFLGEDRYHRRYRWSTPSARLSSSSTFRLTLERYREHEEELAMKYLDGSDVSLFDVVDGGDGEAMVVGIADSEEYAPTFQPSQHLKRDAGVLVVFEDSSLKWRPLPGVPLKFCARSGSDRIKDSDPETKVRLLPIAAIPAYHGFYVDGQRIELLDDVETSNRETGRVVAIISEDLYAPGFEFENWKHLSFGFLVESSGIGLEWYKDADEDLALLHRFQQ